MLKKKEIQTSEKYIIRRIFEGVSEYDTKRVTDLVNCIQCDERSMFVLDVCCGLGMVGNLVAKLYPKIRVHGYDTAIGSIMQAKKVAHDCGLEPQVHYGYGDIENIVLPHNSIDAIVCSNGILLLKDPQKFIQVAYDALVPGGQLVFNTYTQDSFLSLYLHEAVKRVLGMANLPDIKDQLNTPYITANTCINSGFVAAHSYTKTYNYSQDIEKINWYGDWPHPENPLKNISSTDAEKLYITLKEMLYSSSDDNKSILIKRAHILTRAIK